MNKFIELYKNRSKTFYFAGLFLPKIYREKVAKLYYYCRIPDDIADIEALNIDEKLDKLQKYKTNPDIIKFLEDNNIPFVLYSDLLDGLIGDLNYQQPKTMEDLYEYSYKVAGTVGIMMSYLFGVIDKTAHEHAKQLGIAMQFTNILRDIDEDAKNNRIYIPIELMKKHFVTNEQIYSNTFDNNLRELMIELVGISNDRYISGNAGIKYLPKEMQNSIRIASKLYSEILTKIEKNDYNPFLGRVYLNLFEKAAKLIYA